MIWQDITVPPFTHIIRIFMKYWTKLKNIEYQSAAALSSIAKWYLNGKDIPLEQFKEILYSITTNGIQKELRKYRN